MLTESVLLGLAGGAAGLPFSLWLTSVFNAMNAAAVTTISFEPALRVDPSVALFSVGLALAAGLVVGLAPALAATRMGHAGAYSPLRGGVQLAPYAFRRFGVRNLFVGFQVAVAVTLVLVVGYLVIGYQRWSGVDPGFDTDDLTLFVIYPGRDGFTPAQLAAMLRELPERLGALPEVRHATLADRMPLGAVDGGSALANVRVTVPTEGDHGEQVSGLVARDHVGVNYFATLGVPVARGRAFTARDISGGSLVTGRRDETPVVVNQTGSRQLFGDADAVGRTLRTDDGQRYVVVGVVPDVRSAFRTEVLPTVFAPIRPWSLAWSWTEGTTVMVRRELGRDAMAAVRRELLDVYPDLTIFDVLTMDEHMERFDSVLRYNARQFEVLGLFGLALGATGLAGVTSYAVARRRREIGIRLALGARHRQILRLVLREAMILTLVGALAGSAGGIAVSRALSALGLRIRGDLRDSERCDLLGRCPGPVRCDGVRGLLRAGVPGPADRSGLDVAGGVRHRPCTACRPHRVARVAAQPAHPAKATRRPGDRRRRYGDNGSTRIPHCSGGCSSGDGGGLYVRFPPRW